MSLRLITGCANAGKTGVVLGEALAAVRAGASPVLAVPHLVDVRRLEAEISGKAPLGIRVVTLPQLTRDLWSLHGDGRHIVDRATREILLNRIVREGVGSQIAQVARTPGFVRLLAEMARESTPDSLAVASPGSSVVAVDELIGRYREALAEADLVEPAWSGELLGRAAPEIGGPLGVMRFDALGDRDISLLIALAQENVVTVALTWEAAFAPTRANDVAVATLAGIACEHVKIGEPPATGEIQRLARALYEGPRGVLSSGDVVTGLVSGGEAEDAAVASFAADEIGAGVPAERVLIAFRNTRRRADGLERELLSRGISADFEFSLPLSATRFGRAWSALSGLALGRGGRIEALGFISSPFSPMTPQQAHELDRKWRKSRVDNPVLLMRSIAAMSTEAAQAVRLAEHAARGQQSGQGLRSWQELANMLMQSAVSASPGRGLSRDQEQDAAAHQAVVRALAERARNKVKPGDAAEMLAGLTTLPVARTAGESRGRVQVCDFDRVGARRFDVVILGGLTEDEIAIAPDDSRNESSALLDSRQSEIEEVDRVRLLFYSLMTRARTRLYLVRQDADSEGRERRASVLWDDALDAYRPADETAEDEAVSRPPCVRISRDDLVKLAPALTASRREARVAATGLHLRVLERDSVVSPIALVALANRSVFSATEVEAYLECPYRWFYERVVWPEEIDETLDARQLGTRAHGLVAAFYRRVAEQAAHTRVTPGWFDAALALFDSVRADEDSKMGKPEGLAEELAAARAAAWARNVIGQDALWLPEFAPEHVEFEFGDDSAFQFAGSSFRGRIDRIDTSPLSIFVTDYKTSRAVPALAKFEAEAKVQAVIYACAAAETLATAVSGSAYRSMRSGKLSGYWRSDLLGEMPRGMCAEEALDQEGFAALVARTEDRVSAAISGMRAGIVTRAPAVKGACAYCSISTFCEGASR